MLGKNKKQKEINIFDNIPTMADILLPETLQEKKDYLILGYNKFTRIFAMTIYPEQTWVSWLDDLFHIGNINISTIFYIIFVLLAASAYILYLFLDIDPLDLLILPLPLLWGIAVGIVAVTGIISYSVSMKAFARSCR